MGQPTLLILPYTPTLSHISRPLEVAKQLQTQGFHVVFAGFNTAKSKLSFIADAGFTWLPLYEPDPDILYGNIRQGNLSFVSQSILMDMIQADIGLFKSVKPDLVLTDGRFSAMISTQVCHIPHAAIVNASSTQYRRMPYVPLFDRFFLQKIKHNRFHGLCDSINLKLEMAVFDFCMNTFNRLSKKLQLSKKVTATNCLEGKDITFLADIPEYFPIKNAPDNYHYIGPITWKSTRQKSAPDWWPLKETQSPKIYITMGTTGEGSLFSKMYEQFKQSHMVAIVTTGRQSDFQTIADSIYVTDFMDGETILAYADMVVCHGGNGTIYQALSMGKPVVGIPTIPDQDFNMRRVEALGAGIRISMKDAMKKPQSIVAAVEYILENKPWFNQNLAALQTRIRQYSGAQMAGDIIKKYLG